MTASDAFFALPRTTRPADWFERILPTLPLKLPRISLDHAIVYHIHGTGGGTWSVRLHEGQLVAMAGTAPIVGAQVSMSSAHFREALTGALRERIRGVLLKQKRPVALPDLTHMPHDPARVAAVAALGGSIALQISDREYGDTYRYVFTFGGGPAAFEQASSTVEVDADDLAALAVARTPPLQVMVSGKLRIRGDADLPQRALGLLLAR
jgi:hypothetical protein